MYIRLALVIGALFLLPSCGISTLSNFATADNDDSAAADDCRSDDISLYLLEDAYATSSCYRPPTGEIHGYLRCHDLKVETFYFETGQPYYVVTQGDCSLPILGEGWTCETQLWEVPPQ